MPKGNILIVDDNKNVLNALDILLSHEYDKVHCLTNPNLLISELEKNCYHLVLLDMNFRSGVNTGNEGIFWLERIKEKCPEISVVMITAYGDVELAVKALKAGATDFILKPWENAKLLATVRSAIQLNLSREEIKKLRSNEKELKSSLNAGEKAIIGSSPEIMQVLKIVEKVAKTDTNILITGENGTGKELIARRIHQLSDRRRELMVRVDMGAISESLFESELFGHVKGSFTDARENRTGKFELADKGSLFLDEIANLPLSLQPKLLAALQNREITRVGSNQPVSFDIRLICATNRNLNEMVDDGLFREDLLYRINTIQIEVPPLRSREKDIPLLSEFFIEKYSTRYNKRALTIDEQEKEKLLKYRWPGNIRELEHSIEKAVILNESGKIMASDLFSDRDDHLQTGSRTFKLDEMEEKMISMAIHSNSGNIKAAAKQLGITRQTLYNKMKKFGIQ
ncbi:MAG: sigma-54-dependent transcriptional regulator [Bacteroidales bacterium]